MRNKKVIILLALTVLVLSSCGTNKNDTYKSSETTKTEKEANKDIGKIDLDDVYFDETAISNYFTYYLDKDLTVPIKIPADWMLVAPNYENSEVLGVNNYFYLTDDVKYSYSLYNNSYDDNIKNEFAKDLDNNNKKVLKLGDNDIDIYVGKSTLKYLIPHNNSAVCVTVKAKGIDKISDDDLQQLFNITTSILN